MNRQFNIAIFILTIFSWTSISHLLKAQDSVSTQLSPAQVTLAYPLGTDGKGAILSSYYFSLNMLWGITRGIHGAEFGGMGNQTMGAVKGAQLGGLANLVSGEVRGGQFSGIINTSKKLQGAQFGGVVNLASSADEKEDSASSGLQVAGILNVEGQSLRGAQVALINITKNKLKGVQMGGLFNKASSVSGVRRIL